MKTILLILCLFLLALDSVNAQDSLAKKNYTNFNRKRNNSDFTPINHETIQHVLSSGDTLVRDLARDQFTNEILRESSYLHGQKNGLEISYYPNGVVSSVNYYLHGRLWDAISRTDSSGRLRDPGSLHDGNGIYRLYSVYGIDSMGFETYKSGHIEGKFVYLKDGNITEGNLAYKKSAVNYVSGRMVRYTYSSHKVDSSFFMDRDYSTIFLDTSKHFGLVEFSSRKDSALEEERRMLYIPGLPGFGDPAVIPEGIWTVSDRKTNKVWIRVAHDDNGNPIRVMQYNDRGEIVASKEFTPCNKRKQLKIDSQGGIIGEFCPLSDKQMQ